MITNFFRFFILMFGCMAQLYFAQDTPKKDHSEGVLKVNGKPEIVHIFASQNLAVFSGFSEQASNTLVIVNEDDFPVGENNQVYTFSLLQKFQTGGFQFLDKKFKPIDAENTENQLSEIKYLLKSDKKITPDNSVSLDTKFKIWDPSLGIKLGSFTLHYYSLMFVFAFGFGYLLMTRIFKIDNINIKYLDPLFTWTLIGTILGARMGHVIFYQPELFREDFWSVFLPIQTQPEFKFTGFSGLASHGATIMLIFTTLYYSFKIIKKNPFWVYDRLGIVVALGGAFVRIGNFFNSEIIGKPTPDGSFWAVLFPQMSNEYGITVPRYPSQLFEAGGYFLLFVLLWILYKKTNKKYQQGWLFGLFFIILWAIRFFVEFLKEPQGDEFISFGGLNTGQVLSIPFMISGFIIMYISKKYKITEEENQKPD